MLEACLLLVQNIQPENPSLYLVRENGPKLSVHPVIGRWGDCALHHSDRLPVKPRDLAMTAGLWGWAPTRQSMLRASLKGVREGVVPRVQVAKGSCPEERKPLSGADSCTP